MADNLSSLSDDELLKPDIADNLASKSDEELLKPDVADDLSGLSDEELLKPDGDPQFGPGSEMDKYKQEMARIKRMADWNERGIIGEGRKHLGTQPDGTDAFEYDAEHAPAFAPQDDEGKAVHERVKAHEVGELDRKIGHFNLPMKIKYDKKTGKAVGYDTAKPIVSQRFGLDEWYVLPTVWRDERDGNPVEALDEVDAWTHFNDNKGAAFGRFKTEAEANTAKKDIEDLHRRVYDRKWHQWINEHWDEVDDSVKNAPGVKEAHAAWEKAGKPGIRFTMKVDDGEEAADKGEGEIHSQMGILEHGAKSLQSATGKKYGEGEAALLNVVPFGRQAEGYEANRRVAALEKARSGDYKDEELEKVAKDLGFFEDIRPVAATSRSEAKNMLSDMAEAELKDIVRNKQDAALDMEARPLSTWGKVVSATIENSGYVNSFIYGSMMIPVAAPSGGFLSAAAAPGVKQGLKWIGQSALKSVAGSTPVSIVGGMERASGLANKDYELTANDDLRVIDNNYSTLMAAFKGGIGSAVENMVVEGLTEEAIDIGLLGVAKLFLRYPGALDAIKGASRGLVRSGAGRALIKLGRGYNAISQFTQFDQIPSEQLEEIIQPIFDDVIGLGKRKGEKTDTFSEYADKMFTSKNQTEIFLGLVGTMLVQGGAGGVHAARERFSKEGRKAAADARTARAELVEAGADAKMVDTLTDAEAMTTANAYHAMLRKPQLAEDIAKALDDRRGEIFSQIASKAEAKMNADLETLGIERKRFNIPVKSGLNGVAPDFQDQIVINPATGKATKGRMVVDAESGVMIVDNGAGNHENAYTVYDPMTGKNIGVDNLAAAKYMADFLVANQQLYKAHDKIKNDFIEGEWNKNYGNSEMFAARTIDDAIAFSKEHGVDVTKQAGFKPDRRGWRLDDGTVVVVRDNIKTPLEVRQLLRHENIGHSEELSGMRWLDAGGEIGAVREQNLKRVDASNPAERLRAAKEAVANIVQRRAHNPTTGEKISHAIREGVRHFGFDLRASDADLEVAAAAEEKAMREGKGGSFDASPLLRTAVDVYTPDGSPMADAEAMQTAADESLSEEHETSKQEPVNETGNGAHEASAKPEEGAAGQPEVGEAADAKAPEQARGEAADEGVVDQPRRQATVDEVVATAKTPMSEKEEAALREAADMNGIDASGEVPPSSDFLSVLSSEAPIVRLNPAKVDRSDEVLPNMKKDANRKSGITKPLEGEWHPTMGGIGAAWLTKDGKLVVITGRHRSELAERKGKSMLYYLYREADGFTKDDAVIYDAVANIHDEKGTINDYIAFLDRISPSREQAEKAGILYGKGLTAWSIYKDATEAVRRATALDGRAEKGQISPDEATTIAEAAPKDAHERNPFIQSVLLRSALAGMKGREFVGYAREMTRQMQSGAVNKNLLEGEQMDLFQDEDFLAMEALTKRRNEYRARKSNEYDRVARNLRGVLNNESRLELTDEFAKDLGVTDKNDRKQLEKAYDLAVERAAYWDPAGDRVLDDADVKAMDAEINAKADAAAAKRAEVKAKAEAKLAAIKAKREGKPAPKSAAEAPTAKSKPEKSTEKPSSQNNSTTRQELANTISSAFGIPIKVIGADGKVEADSTATAEAAITGKKPAPRQPFVKMKNAEEEAALNDALDALFFSPEMGPDYKKYRAFDVLQPNLEIKTTHGNSRKQAEGYVNKDRAKFPHGGIVYEQGNAKNAIIQNLNQRGYGTYVNAAREYPDAIRISGAYFARAVEAGITHAGTEFSADAVIRQVVDGGVESSGNGAIVPIESAVNGKSERARERGWRYFSDGTVIIPLYDGHPKTASRAVADILKINTAFGGYEVVGFAKEEVATDGGKKKSNFHFIAKGPKVSVREDPLFERRADFLKSHGFAKKVNSRFGDGLWWRDNPHMVVDEAELNIAKTVDGGHTVLHADIAGPIPLGLDADFMTPEMGGAKDFQVPTFDPETFQQRIGAAAKVVDVLQRNGHGTFADLATVIAERKPEVFENIKPFLQDIWNAVARARGLKRVTDEQADEIYGIINTQTKEVNDDRRGVRREVSEGESAPGGSGAVGLAEGQPASEGGEREPGGSLAGGRGREQGSDEQVDSQRSGAVPGQPQGVADKEVRGEGTERGGGASAEAVSVDDSAGHERGERDVGRHSGGSGAAEEGQRGEDNDPSPRGRVVKAAKKAADSTKPNPFRRDFVMTKAVEEAILEKSPIKRIRQNIAAIKLIRELAQKDFVATPDEQATLAKYVGWGGLSEMFSWEYDHAWSMERDGEEKSEVERYARRGKYGVAGYEAYKELRQTLNDEEYASARASTTTAFYTPIYFVEALHENLRYLGVKGGRFLGPSAGTGNFASAAGEYEKPVNWQFVEKDQMTGMILKALFPNQRVNIGGFEETKFPDGFFDFAIDNVPYADVSITDRSLSPRSFKIHDYFFAKTLAKLRPGGVMAFLTSTGTLDKSSPILRQFLTEHGGKIVGAVRLPNGFFSENAGTDVASDLVIVQKVQERPDNSAFEKGVEYGKTEEWVRRKGRIEKPLTYNGYFNDHPEQIVGRVEVGSGQFGPTLKYTMPDVLLGDLSFEISKAIGRALGGIDKDALLKSVTVTVPEERAPVYDDEGLRQGNVTLKDGKPYIKSGEMLEPIPMPNDRALSKELGKRLRTGKQIVEGLIDLRKAMRGVIDAQMRGINDEGLKPLLATLNKVYDKFVKKNGTLHDKWIMPFVMLDKADGNRMLALERTVKDADGKSSVVKSDIFTKRVISLGQRATSAGSPKEALIISYSETGGINIPRIANLLDMTGEEAIAALKGSGDAFENPQTGLLEPSWEYLSGRVRAKLAAARAAVEAGEEAYRANVEALGKVQPPMVKLEDTEIKFGATWVDPECMKDFLRDAFGSEHMRINLNKNELTGLWNIEFGHIMNADPWGETSWSPQEFVSRVLNHGSMEHFVVDPIDGKRYLDEKRTEANKLAADKLHSAFSQFIQSSEKWATPMYERYNAVMTDNVGIKLPNNILPFRAAGMSEETLRMLFEDGDPSRPKKGREYQSDVIARGVLGGSSLCLAHCVGAGKTLEMQSIGMLGRRLGMFKKSMYVVPNHMLDQFVNEFTRAFPDANILKMTAEDVKPANRRAFFAQVANGDWDAIVVKHSTFSQKLGMSKQYQEDFMIQQKKDLMAAIAAMKEAGERISVQQSEKMLARLEEKIKKLGNAEGKDKELVPFEELGVDQLFVDEAHNFKGMPITTRQRRKGGLSQGDSQRAEDMHMKTQYVQSLHGGTRGVVFATGTPLSNAPVVEAYVILKYLAPNKLAEQGLSHFDDFVDAFGRITTETEFSPDGKTTKEKDKVSAFVNIPDFMKLFRSVVDIVNSDQLDIPRPAPKYHMIDVDMTDAQRVVMEAVAREAGTPASKEWRSKYMDLTWVAKYACITPKMLGIDELGNKVLRVASEVKKVYDETADNRGAQLIFTDRFEVGYEEAARRVLGNESDIVGNAPFNLNNELKDLLVRSGIPADEIAIIQDIDKSKGDKDANKEALFAKVRAGEVRVLIGSRQKMGEGTNVQERLAAIHLLHPGWKPSEDEQAIGRIIRNGNMFKEGQIFYYLTKGNENIGSYETKNHQLIGVKSKLIDQVMHGDESVRSVDMDESQMDRDMLMGLASGNKALMELVDVKKRVHKLELNTESTLTSARRNKDKAEANARVLERRREEFAKEQEGAKEWREKNGGKPFALSTPDGRSIEKVKDMADYVSSRMVQELAKDRYDREDETVLGNFNGVDLVLVFDKWGDEKFRLAVPLLGVAREINYSGFLPDFTTGAMTAFKGRIFETVSPDFAKAQETTFADLEKQAKKMSADADKLQKDYEQMRDELVKLRTRQVELERAVTPLVVQATEDRKTALYGNWSITRPGKGQLYVAQRESDGKSLSAPTVKELIPLMDAEDFASPKNAAAKTPELRLRFVPKSINDKIPHVDFIPAGQVDFDTPELSPDEAEYAESEDKTPTEKVMREVYGMTNDEIATALKAAGMEPPKHVRKSDETTWKQAEALLSNPSYMAKLSRAVAKFPRNIADYENDALNVLFRQRQAAVNAAQSVVDVHKEALDAYDAFPKEDRGAEWAADREKAAADYAEAKSKLSRAKSLMFETGLALTRSSSIAGRRLRSNRGLIDQTDYSYAGISGRIAAALGGADRISPEMDARIREIAGEFAALDDAGREIATARLKAQAEKIVEQIKQDGKRKRSVEARPGDEAKRVMRNYNDALAQIEVGAAEVGGTLIGLSDQQYPAWGKWLKWIGEFHCFTNPDITEEECVRAIASDISPFMDGVDENQVRDALTGYGHNYRLSRYDSQRLMNDLRAQSLEKVKQREMREKGTMPLATGPQRDEPSDALRAERKTTYEMKKEIPDEARDARHLKGLLDSAKTRIKNRIADMERAIETGEKIPAAQRKVVEDIELRNLKKRKAELQAVYDEMFKTERGMTVEQRIAATERALAHELEMAMEDFARAQAGDFSKRPRRPGVTSETIETLRGRLNEVRNSILELKKAKYAFGMTPEELEAHNARKMANREKVVARLAERIVNGDLRLQKKPQPPMPPEMQKRYDEMGEQMKRARQHLADMRLEAENATAPTFVRKAGDYARFVTTAQRALRATMDFSAVLRQAARITLAHPVMGAKAFGKAWDAAHSEANLMAVNDEIMSDPTIQEAVAKYGLHLREVDVDATDARDVEMFHGMERNKVRIFGKEFAITDIPFFGEFMLKSERHYITYLNAASAELYSAIVNDKSRFPAGATAWQKKMVADMINIWNGSAALSKERRQALQKAWVNDIFWAPQLAISRVQSAALYDVWRPLVAKGVKNADGGYDAVSPEERKTMFKIGASEHIKSSLAMIALGALLKWMFAGDDDWYDFKQADWFEKLMMLVSPKIGNTTIDFTGGEQSVNRAAHKIWDLATSGEVRTNSGKMAKMGSYGGPTVWGVIGRYLQGKTSPWLSETVALWEGRDYVGNDYTWKDAVIGAVVPLTFEDMKDQLIQNGVGMSLITMPLSLLGAGGSTYDRKPYENAVNRFKEDKESLGAEGAKIDKLTAAVDTLERRINKTARGIEQKQQLGGDVEEAQRRIEAARQALTGKKEEVLRLIRENRK